MSSDAAVNAKGKHALTDLPPVNHFDIKRQAHSVSRGSSDVWNPFRHVWKRDQRGQRDPTRAGTWDVTREEQFTGTNVGLAHTVSAPDTRVTSRDFLSGNESPPMNVRKPQDDSLKPVSEDVNEDRPLTTTSAVGSEVGLRNRKHEEDKVPVSEETDDSKTKPKQQGFFKHLTPKEPFTVANQIQRTLLSSWINVLLVAAPVGIALNYVKSVDRIAVFVINFIAIVPLAAMLSFATEEIALRTGETLGGLLNATFGNAVELIVAIIALIDGKVAIVQTSLIGSILSNLLLVMGCCFFFGGLRRQEQYFNTVVAQTAASMLALAAASVIVPTVFDAAAGTPVESVAKLSRGTAVILLVVYAAYLFFQLKTHSSVFNEESQKSPAKPWGGGTVSITKGVAMAGAVIAPGHVTNQDEKDRMRQILMNPPHINASEDDEEGEDPQLHFWVAIGTLAGSTVIIALCAEFMVDSIDAITTNGGLSEEFVGLILLPIVGNAAEHATAVTVAMKDKMDLAIGVAVGSSMQVALFLIPLLVVIGWGMGNDAMNLSFDTFQVAVMFVAVLLVNYLIGDGKSHWLEGWLLICLYCIIAVCAIWYPDQDTGHH